MGSRQNCGMLSRKVPSSNNNFIYDNFYKNDDFVDLRQSLCCNLETAKLRKMYNVLLCNHFVAVTFCLRCVSRSLLSA